MSSRLTIQQLEQMKTHDLADLLSNVVLLLRRMPNVACAELMTQPDEIVEPVMPPPARHSEITADDLAHKTVAQLKALAAELHVNLPSKAKKSEILSKLRARHQGSGSEQYAIEHL